MDHWPEGLRGLALGGDDTDGPLPGVPALTRNDHGEGRAWYLATRLDAASRATVSAVVRVPGRGAAVVREQG